MANLKSAKKQAKRSEIKRKRNLSRKSAIKTTVKKFLVAVESKDIKKSQELLKEAEARLERAQSKGVIHSNTASRKISRLAKRLNKLTQQQPSA